MRTTLHINIPEPCHEDWNKMTPQDKGRHCASCQKTVFDFTTSTDEQIVKTFKSEGNLCGRFKSNQLDRELVLSRKEKNNYLSFVASTLFAFLSLGTQDVEAQGKPRVVKIDSSDLNMIRGKVGVSVLNEKVVRGKVTSQIDGLILPGVNIKVKGTDRGVQTGFDGLYKIKAKKGETLVFTFASMITEEKVITDNTVINLIMNQDDCLLDEIVVGVSSSELSPCEREKRKKNKQKEVRKLKRQNIKNKKIKPNASNVQTLGGAVQGVEIQTKKADKKGLPYRFWKIFN